MHRAVPPAWNRQTPKISQWQTVTATAEIIKMANAEPTLSQTTRMTMTFRWKTMATLLGNRDSFGQHKFSEKKIKLQLHRLKLRFSQIFLFVCLFVFVRRAHECMQRCQSSILWPDIEWNFNNTNNYKRKILSLLPTKCHIEYFYM